MTAAAEDGQNIGPRKNGEDSGQDLVSLDDGGAWKRFKQWIHCFAVVTFDLELGQTIEMVYPGDSQLSPNERADLCYLAFPDSNSSLKSGQEKQMSSNFDSAHHFRVRRSSLDEHDQMFVQSLPTQLRPDGRFYNGFAHFRQQKNVELPRGYSQKSIVLLSPFPFVPLFQRVLNEVALAYFNCCNSDILLSSGNAGETAIETACRQIGLHWPEPVAGHRLCFPILGMRFLCTIPLNSEGSNKQYGEWNDTTESIFPRRQSVDEVDKEENMENGSHLGLKDDDFEMVDCLDCNPTIDLDGPSRHFHAGVKRILPHMHLLWELVLLGEPLLLLAPNPALSSALVHSLTQLIAPLRYHGDYRPYFTIHDSDFNEMCSRQNSCVNSCILGVTNPFFLKALCHWPHILKLSASSPNSVRRERSESRLLRQLRVQPAAQLVLFSLRRSGTTGRDMDQQQQQWIQLGDFENGERCNGEGHTKMLKRLWDRTQLDHRSGGLLSAHKPFLAQDKSLIRKLLRTPSDPASQWATLLAHFHQLTMNFMNPFESYICSLMPLRKQLSPFQPLPPIRPFSLEHFIGTLRHFGHPGVKGDWHGLYRQFVTRSPNFVGWLRQRQRDIEYQLKQEHLELVCNAELSPRMLAQRNQVEIVDLVLKLTNRLAELEILKLGPVSKLAHQSSDKIKNGLIASKEVEVQRNRLLHQLNKILDSVDMDLKQVLLSNTALRKAVVDDHGKE